jgi:hypothetical protein
MSERKRQFTIYNGGIYRESHNHDSLGYRLGTVPDKMTDAEAGKRLSTTGSLSGLTLARKREVVRLVLSGEDASAILAGYRDPGAPRPDLPRVMGLSGLIGVPRSPKTKKPPST